MRRRGLNPWDPRRYTGRMTTALPVAILVALLVVIALLALLLRRRPDAAVSALRGRRAGSLRGERRQGGLERHKQLEALTGRTDQRLDKRGGAVAEDARKARLEGAEGQQRFADQLGQRLAELTQR